MSRKDQQGEVNIGPRNEVRDGSVVCYCMNWEVILFICFELECDWAIDWPFIIVRKFRGAGQCLTGRLYTALGTGSERRKLTLWKRIAYFPSTRLFQAKWSRISSGQTTIGCSPQRIHFQIENGSGSTEVDAVLEKIHEKYIYFIPIKHDSIGHRKLDPFFVPVTQIKLKFTWLLLAALSHDCYVSLVEHGLSCPTLTGSLIGTYHGKSTD